MNIQPLHNHILFKFVDDSLDGHLITKTKSGIMMTRNITYDEQKDPRWAVVQAVGPGVMDDSIVVNEYILIEPLQWTVGADFGDGQIWKTDESKILATSKEMIYRY